MFINYRTKPHSLIYFEALAARTELSKEEMKNYSAIKKGYEGELLYDRIFDNIGHENLIIYRDLYLQINNTCTQYDTLIINDTGIVINEVKNFSGNCSFQNGQWHNGKYPFSDDALSQLRRAEGNLMKMRNSTQNNFNISGKLIFPNDSFTLHSEDQSIWNKIILRSGLRDYFRQFNNSGVRSGDKAQYISRLISSHMIENPYFEPAVDKNRLKLGLYCGQCGNFNLTKNRFHLTCNKCGCIESNETHLLRAANDFKFLFYNQPMTRNSLLEFIDNDLVYHTVSRFLFKHCYFEKKGNNSSYTFKYFDYDEAIKKASVNVKYKDKYPMKI